MPSLEINVGSYGQEDVIHDAFGAAEFSKSVGGEENIKLSTRGDATKVGLAFDMGIRFGSNSSQGSTFMPSLRAGIEGYPENDLSVFFLGGVSGHNELDEAGSHYAQRVYLDTEVGFEVYPAIFHNNIGIGTYVNLGINPTFLSVYESPSEESTTLGAGVFAGVKFD